MNTPNKPPNQCSKPSGIIGRLMLWSMNRRHSDLTDWGLQHVRVEPSDIVLDVGCGGGRTLDKLAAMVSDGRVCGIDYAEESVEASRRFNQKWIERRRVEIQHASVSQLPFADDTFDVVTAVETHFWWPDLAHDMREVWRVVKPGGHFIVIAEFYDGGKHAKYVDRLTKAIGIAALTVEQHREMLANAGFDQIQIEEDEPRGWISASGTKPVSA